MIGRVNVGKSSLFNRLTHSRDALVNPEAGLTRDLREGEVRYEGARFTLVDSGGLGWEGTYATDVFDQVQSALRRAVHVWLVADAVHGHGAWEDTLAQQIRRAGRSFSVVMNKVDNASREGMLGEFYGMGAKDLHPVSVLHGRGLQDLLDATLRLLPPATEALSAFVPPVRMALFGRPNVGKSSLANRLLGQDRMIVSAEAGTTREAIPISLHTARGVFVLIDSAGVRRRSRTPYGLEKLGVVHTLHALENADVAVLVVDASEPMAEQDQRLAGIILERGRGLVVALNKWDLLNVDEAKAQAVEELARRRLRFAAHAPLLRVSALRGWGDERLLRTVSGVAAEHSKRITTGDLNRVLREVVHNTPPPALGRFPTRIYYAAQVRTAPPVFCLHTNHTQTIPRSYTLFIVQRLRYHFGFSGCPIQIHWHDHHQSSRTSLRAKGSKKPRRALQQRPRKRPGGKPRQG